MPAPTSATTLQRPDLGAIAYEFMKDSESQGFIGLEVLPMFEVPQQSMDYPKIPIEAFMKLQKTQRAPRGNYNRTDYEFETGTFKCEEHGWEEALDDSEAELYRRFFDGEELAVLRAVNILMRNHERRVAVAVQDTGNITNTAAVATEWSTVATATPRRDVFAAKEALRAATGVIVTDMAINMTVFNNLLRSAEVIEALKYTNPFEMGSLQQQIAQLGQYFGLNIHVAGGQYDSTKKGQSYTLADIWDDEYCLLYAKSEGMDLQNPSLGRTFLWTADSPDMLNTEQYREEGKRSSIYRVRHNVDEAFIFTGAGYLLSNITA
jgi:hypothetical protein